MALWGRGSGPTMTTSCKYTICRQIMYNHQMCHLMILIMKMKKKVLLQAMHFAISCFMFTTLIWKYASFFADPKLWGDPAVALLISLYSERRNLFKTSKSNVRHTTLYQEIAAIMKLFDYDRSFKQCQRKMSQLLDQFRKEFDKERRTGQAPSTWKWFQTILEMEEGCPNLNAPFAFSVGAQTQYNVQGTQKPLVEKRNTRTRTANASHTADDDEDVDNPEDIKDKGAKGKKKEVAKKQLYKSWLQQTKEKSAEAQDKAAQAKLGLVEEVRLLRLAQVENSAPKNEALKTMAQAMLNISAYCTSLAEKK